MSFIIDCFADAHTWTKDRRGLCYLSLFLSTKLAAEITVYWDENGGKGDEEKSGWSSTVIRLNEASRERKFYRDAEQSMILHGIISGFEREKLLHQSSRLNF